MRNLFTITSKLFLLTILFFSLSSYSQTTMNRQEAAIKRAEDRLNDKRIKLVEYKIQIDRQDSLFSAGEDLVDKSENDKKQAKAEIKELEKKYKIESKNASKARKVKDNSVAVVAQKDYNEITLKYKEDLRVLEDRVKTDERSILNGERMIDRASKKLDLLADRLKQAEKAYKAAEKDLEEKRGAN